ncbi:MAG: sulfite exporter TauE/SafE family protein, partial [Betaproteobacteria bacterium]|nr:sulfite exporter TauE/SafE family protein [Betaproteobacteria bacterium]
MPGFESFSLGIVLWLVAAVLLAGFIQGALGFGFPFVATPMVAMVVDMRTAI